VLIAGLLTHAWARRSRALMALTRVPFGRHFPPAVNDVSVLAQGQACLWVGSTSGQICQLDLRSGMVRRCWQGHQGLVSGILSRSSCLISASADKTVAVWRVDSSVLHTSQAWDHAWASPPGLATWSGTEAASRLYLTDPVVALDSIGSKMAAAVAGGVVLADAPVSVSQSRLKQVRSNVVSLAAMPYSRTLFVGCEDGKIRCCY
jgi:WD40 repeat protein